MRKTLGAEAHSYFVDWQFTYGESLVPLFSQTKLRGCHADLHLSSIHVMGPWQKDHDEVAHAFQWEARIPTLFWRGSTTGGPHHLISWRDKHRIRLTQWAKRFAGQAHLKSLLPNISCNANLTGCQDVLRAGSDLVDIGLSDVIQCDPEACKGIKDEVGVAGRREHEDMFRYRYLLVVDGNSFANRLPCKALTWRS